ncbi:hypothetical protein, partial [Emergencia timonensis]|uniref:hypothetical protein n=1 Tax=Emergencia timonensis TaxID=1776384 RepID=UPI00266D67EE
NRYVLYFFNLHHYTDSIQVVNNNLRMKAHWFTIIKKTARNKQKSENEGASVAAPLAFKQSYSGSLVDFP